MTFSMVNDLLSRQVEGETRSPAAAHLGLRLQRFARGVAAYELPVATHACDPEGCVENGVLTALAEAAMTAAATTIVDDGHGLVAFSTRELSAHFARPVRRDEADALQAEAIVMRRDGWTVSVEADVLCAGERVATFVATCAPTRQITELEAVA
jgi:uncharacterized protein (TIGR00369 family)